MSKNKFNIHIKAETDERIREELRECAEIITGLSEAYKSWDAEYGYDNRQQLNKWKKRATEWVNKHKIIV